MNSQRSAYVWMLAGAAAFAVMAVLTSELRSVFGWQWIAAARSGLALLFAAVLVVAARQRFLVFKPAGLWWRSLAGSASLLCGFFAMTHYDVAVVLTLTNMYPLWVAVLSWPMLGRRPSLDTWVAAAVGVTGVAVLMGADLHYPAVAQWAARQTTSLVPARTAGGVTAALAIGASLVSAFTSALALISLHRLRTLDHRAVVVHFSGTAFLFCLAAAWLLPCEPVRPDVPLQSWLMLLAVGATATVGQLFLTKAFAYGDPGRVSVVGLSQICFAMLLESFWNGQHYTMRTLAGMALVMLPTAWVMWRSYAASNRSAPRTQRRQPEAGVPASRPERYPIEC
ncbi:MAG: membrane protein [Pirellulaceae bacterium]|nr:MAG: membrane protein [Pirellulaceae bacterium]